MGQFGISANSLIALSIGVGSAAGSLFIGKLLDLFGARPVISLCAMVYPLSIIPLGYFSGFWFTLVFGAVLGLFRGALDTALNTHGVQVERFYRRSIMSAFHASYSFGGFLLGMILQLADRAVHRQRRRALLYAGRRDVPHRLPAEPLTAGQRRCAAQSARTPPPACHPHCSRAEH
jgi:predicted MFS family arabinose efflux permease